MYCKTLKIGLYFIVKSAYFENYLFSPKNLRKLTKDYRNQGCQIFHGTTYKIGENVPKWEQNLPNDRKI
jgi:hypothetical protein